MKEKTNFDLYLEDQLKNKNFAARFENAGEAWDIALKLAALRKEAGLSQKELARKAGTSQQQISRLESPTYEGHSLSMLRKVADALGATIHLEILRGDRRKDQVVAERRAGYANKKINGKQKGIHHAGPERKNRIESLSNITQSIE